jgi:hypothetical protein
MDRRDSEVDNERHLTDAELLGLAAPASGEPEPLPRHLSVCESCSRALQEWQTAMRETAREDVEELERRTPEEWRAAENATMAAIRRVRPKRRASAVRWAAGIAAALLLLALAMPFRRSATQPPVAVATAQTAPTAPTTAAETPNGGFATAGDRDDDALLRDVEFLARGGDDHVELLLEDNL